MLEAYHKNHLGTTYLKKYVIPHTAITVLVQHTTPLAITVKVLHTTKIKGTPKDPQSLLEYVR